MSVRAKSQLQQPDHPRIAMASASLHVLYSADDVPETAGRCDADLLAPIVKPGTLGGGSYQAGGAVTAELGCDTDFEYFSDHGAGTQAQIESVINTMNLQYVADVGITHEISALLIRTSSNDLYTKKVANQLLNQVRSEWNKNQSGVPRDVVQLFTGRSLAGSTIGAAYVGTVCNLNVAYSLVQSDFANNFACSTDLSAHELGHTWGAGHCSCSNYTMNASITCANAFNPSLTIPDIIAYRNSQTCFGAPPTTGTVAGTVTSSAGGAPIAGATVQVDSGQADTPAADGSYSIAGVPTGTRTVTASASGFTAQNAGATVSVSVDLNGASFGTASGTTDSAGEVTFNAKNSPNGCYETDVTSVNASGLSFDGTEPLNGFDKGNDASPDPDCRSSSDACGAG